MRVCVCESVCTPTMTTTRIFSLTEYDSTRKCWKMISFHSFFWFSFGGLHSILVDHLLSQSFSFNHDSLISDYRLTQFLSIFWFDFVKENKAERRKKR